MNGSRSLHSHRVNSALEKAGFPCTSWDWLLWQSTTRPAAIAWWEWHRDRWNPLDWEELTRMVLDLSGQFERQGLKVGDRVLSRIPNSLAWVVLELACSHLELVHVPLDSRTSLPHTRDCIQTIRPSVIVWGDDNVHETDEIGANLSGVQLRLHRLDSPDPLRYRIGQAVSGNSITGNSIDRFRIFAEFQNLSKRAMEDGEGDPFDTTKSQDGSVGPREERLATILFTSGTSRGMKGVMLSHRNLIENALGKLDAMPQNAQDIRFNFLPFSHAYARTCEFSTWLISGCAMSTVPCLEAFWRLAPTLSPTLINGVPFFYRQLFEKCCKARVLSRELVEHVLGGQLRMLGCGGAGLPGELARAFRELGWPIHQGYGLTETSPVVCSQRWSPIFMDKTEPIKAGMASRDAPAGESISARESVSHVEDPDGHVGWPISNIEIRIDEQRQVCVRGPNVMMGYWKDPVATQQRIVEGWLQTGDVGEFCSNGALRILGRLDDVIVLQNGRKVDPLPLELQIQGDPLFRRAILAGYGREFVVAIVVIDGDRWNKVISKEPISDSKRLEARLLERIAERLRESPRYAIPRRVFWLMHDLRLELGEVTAKGTVRRQVFLESMEKELSKLYSEPT